MIFSQLTKFILGLMSGLTIGLMSIDPMTLEVIRKGGDSNVSVINFRIGLYMAT
jgi:metal transporter CNNM